MNKPTAFLFLLQSSCSLLADQASPADELPRTDSSKPNILFLIVDDLGRNDLSLHGSTFHQTPHIDQLGKEGLIFQNAYCAHPRCGPSRYAIFSGRIPARDGMPGYLDYSLGKHPLALSRITFAERLRDSGYHTGYIGKWHLGRAGGEPDKQGFTDSRIAGPAGAPPSYFQPYHISKSGKSKEDFPAIPGPEGEYLTDRLASEAVDFLKTRPTDKPFLLVVANYAVHTPFEAPQPLVKKYQQILSENNKPTGGTNDDPDFRNSDNATDKTVQNNPIYAAMVEKTDGCVGRILGTLKELKLDQNTLVVLTSDHGGLSTRSSESNRPLATTNAPYRHGKGWLYDGGLRVPHLVRWPAVIKPGTTSIPTHGTDHYLTFLDVAGLSSSEKLDGKSYLPSLKGNPEKRGPIFFHSPQARPQSTGDSYATALIAFPWKIIQHHDPQRYELFHLEDDPSELNDLSKKKPKQLARFTKLLLETKKETKARQGGRNPFDKARANLKKPPVSKTPPRRSDPTDR